MSELLKTEDKTNLEVVSGEILDITVSEIEFTQFQMQKKRVSGDNEVKS